MLQLAECLRLDLTDTLTRDVEFLTDFFQRAGAAVIETEPEAENLLFPLRQSGEYTVYLVLQELVVCIFIR